MSNSQSNPQTNAQSDFPSNASLDSPADSHRKFERRTVLRAAAGAGVVAGTSGLALPRSFATASGPAEPTAVVLWNRALLRAVREVVPPTPAVSRALAIVHTCMFDAWAAYDDWAVGTRLGGALRRPTWERTAENRREAVSFAAYRALVDLFPGRRQVDQLDALMRSLGYDPSDRDGSGTTPAAIGTRAAREVLAFRHRDDSNQLGDPPYADTSGYEPVNSPDRIDDPNRWQPLRVPQGDGTSIVQQFVTPHWGGVTPFALRGGSQMRPGRDPAHFGHPLYRRQAQQVLGYSARLTERQKVIAEYWAGGPGTIQPPGYWTEYAQFVSARDRHGLDDDVVLFFAVGNAVFDAGIACWDCKVHFDYIRPISAIHYLFGDRMVWAWAGPYQGTGLIRGRDWRPYQAADFVTPPFAEFTSGHSTFSAAGAEVLKRFTGSDRFGGSHVQPQGESLVEPSAVPSRDLRLYWPTFSAAANEAGVSRRYGGIHFVQADLVGRRMGRRVGRLVWQRVRGYVTGRGR